MKAPARLGRRAARLDAAVAVEGGQVRQPLHDEQALVADTRAAVDRQRAQAAQRGQHLRPPPGASRSAPWWQGRRKRPALQLRRALSGCPAGCKRKRAPAAGRAGQQTGLAQREWARSGAGATHLQSGLRGRGARTSMPLLVSAEQSHSDRLVRLVISAMLASACARSPAASAARPKGRGPAARACSSSRGTLRCPGMTGSDPAVRGQAFAPQTGSSNQGPSRTHYP